MIIKIKGLESRFGKGKELMLADSRGKSEGRNSYEAPVVSYQLPLNSRAILNSKTRRTRTGSSQGQVY